MILEFLNSEMPVWAVYGIGIICALLFYYVGKMGGWLAIWRRLTEKRIKIY